jgi:hypothetical protein
MTMGIDIAEICAISDISLPHKKDIELGYFERAPTSRWLIACQDRYMSSTFDVLKRTMFGRSG